MHVLCHVPCSLENKHIPKLLRWNVRSCRVGNLKECDAASRPTCSRWPARRAPRSCCSVSDWSSPLLCRPSGCQNPPIACDRRTPASGRLSRESPPTVSALSCTEVPHKDGSAFNAFVMIHLLCDRNIFKGGNLLANDFTGILRNQSIEELIDRAAGALFIGVLIHFTFSKLVSSFTALTEFSLRCRE